MVKWLVAFLLVAGAACTLLDSDPPGSTCKTNTDCFQAQGEVCNTQSHHCEVKVRDAGIDAVPDAGVDAP